MKKIVIGVICLIALFTVIRGYSQDRSRFTIQPSVIEYADRNTELSMGFGFVDAKGDATKSWNLFPVRLMLRSGNSRFYLALNGLSLLTQSGVYFENPKVINGVHSGDVISIGGDVTVRGRVEGNVWVFGSNAYLKSDSVVTGDVVAIGGVVNQEARAVVRGNKNSLPHFSIPFLGIIASARTAATLHFLIELAGMILYLLILFLVLFFRESSLRRNTEGIFSEWKRSLFYLGMSIIVIPVLVFFLTASVVGVLAIPVLAVMIVGIGYFGFLSVTLRVGRIFLKGQDSTAHFFLSGLVGLLCLKGPMLAGILLSLLANDVINLIASTFKVVGSIAILGAFLYGFGAGIVSLRKSAS